MKTGTIKTAYVFTYDDQTYDNQTHFTPICPRCIAHTLGTVPVYLVATNVVRRQCRKCRTRWQVKIVPVEVQHTVVQQMTFTSL